VVGAFMNCIWNVTPVIQSIKLVAVAIGFAKKLQRISVTLVNSAMSWTWCAIYLATGIPDDHFEQKPL
jgi:hypothetical protein